MNLVEGIQKECNRCRKLIALYEEIPMGNLSAHFIQESINEGEAAVASGDVLKMLSAFKELEGCE